MISLKERLKSILIQNKLLTCEQLEQALALQREKGARLSEILVSAGFVQETALMSAVSSGMGLPVIDLKRLKIDKEVARLIPKEVGKHYLILPLSRIGDTLTLAMANPLDVLAIEHVESLTGYRINPVISSSRDILQILELSFEETVDDGEMDKLVKEISSGPLEFLNEEHEISLSEQELSLISKQAPVIRVTDAILMEAVRKRASDVLVEPFDKKLRVRLRVDGVLQEINAPPPSMHASIISRMKVMSELDIAEHRLPQDGRFNRKIDGHDVDFRISVIPTSFGEKAALRVLDTSQAMLDIDKLGLSDYCVAVLKKAASLPHGMILVCGPTGSGKTTTLYSLLKHVGSPDRNLVTVEDPVEYQLSGINQVTVHPDIGLTFASALRSILRQDPDVIMIGEIRDFETVDMSIKSALTGHLVLSTLHTTTASGAIARLVNMGVEPYLINASLICTVAQRLVRKICPHCREPYILGKDAAVGLKLPANEELRLFRGKGCQACSNTGYSGRISIAEVLVLSPGIKSLIFNMAQEHVIKKQAVTEGMQTLREQGMVLAREGATTVEEVFRVTVSDD
ncbi:MAG: ATPase, T2SS/T4P/T4SS family [Candidatus Omnitrophota bacterium]|jgi:type IV pilus assembly protein PilB